ncbi:MAG TPA: DUF927 domain-containing protein [Azospirillaceae bacterium]|nr:DUF927 domain-containing protein [Azospirillaceae bacterium]
MTTMKCNDGDIVLKDDGVFRKLPDGRLNRIAPSIAYAADVVEEPSARVFATLVCGTADGRRVELRMQPADFRTWIRFRDLVLNHGYDLPHDPALGKIIHRRLVRNGPGERRLAVHRIGWHGSTFVLPGGRYEDGERIVVFQPLPNGRVGNFASSGTLEGWREGVAIPALASSRLMLAIALAFAATLLRFTDFDNGGLHLFGPSSKGKTTCLLAALSVKGAAERRDMLTWNITEAGLAETAMGHSDSLMCIDELANTSGTAAQVAKRMQKTAFTLASGTGLIRSKAYVNQQNMTDATWRVLVLSSGEKGLNDLAGEGALERLKGEAVRFIDVPAIVDEGLGIYERLPDGFSSPAGVSEAIEAACRDHHGVALPVFVREVSARTDTIAGDIATRVEKFMTGVGVPSDGWERRFARLFALSYAAACLAAEWGILPWTSREAGRAIRRCYLAARGQIPDVENLRDDGIVRFREFLRGETVLRRRRNGSDIAWAPEAVDAAEAFRRKTRDRGAHFLIKPDAFQRRFSPLTRDLLLKWLKAEGHLIMETGRPLPTIQARVPGVEGRLRYYAVRAAVLRDEPHG